MSGLINKAKESVKEAMNSSKRDNNDPGHHGTTTTSGGAYNDPSYSTSTNEGPHNSNLANKLDPRVDSDRDGRNDPTSRTGGIGNTQQPGDGYGQANTTGVGGQGGAYGHSGPTGTHVQHAGSAGYGEPGMGGTHTGPGHEGYGAPHGGPGGPGGYGAPAGGVAGHGSNQYDDPRSTNAGPHSSNLMNKADPRVDSDRDNRNDPTSRVGGYGDQQGYGGNQPGYGAHPSSAQHDDPRSTNAGPHSSNLMNKADPRVDSDRDNRNDPTSRVGGYGDQQGYGVGAGVGAGAGGLAAQSVGGPHHGAAHGHQGAYGGTHEGVAGPRAGAKDGFVGGQHDTYGAGPGVQGGVHQGGIHGGQDTYGAGPGVAGGQGYGGPGQQHHGGPGNQGYGSSATPGSGDAPSTAGPHNSNLLNKLDPRVDSDMDGSKTYGGNQTMR